MTYQEIISMMDARQVNGRTSSAEIGKLIASHPYCSSFQVLKAIALKEEDHLKAKEQLALAAVYIQDRSKLYDYIVKDALLETVSNTVQEEVEAPTESIPESPVTASAEVLQPVAEIEDTPEKVTTEAKAEPIISSDPLEEQIMREAVMHIGEMEVAFSLDELEAKPELTPTKETVEEDPVPQEAPSSFGAWLLQVDGGQSETEKPKQELSQNLIDKFIQESPQISPVKTAFFSPSQMGKMSLVEDESFVTETLAKIYEKQGDFKKAASAYKNLQLKYPEKSVYFANLQKQAEEKSKNLK